MLGRAPDDLGTLIVEGGWIGRQRTQGERPTWVAVDQETRVGGVIRKVAEVSGSELPWELAPGGDEKSGVFGANAERVNLTP